MEEKKKQEKLTYEQLEQINKQMGAQMEQMYAALKQAEMTNIFKRLDYLFKVLDHVELFSKPFVTASVKEIEETITIPEEEKESKPEKK